MHLLKQLINFYIFSNLHVALAGLCLVKITMLKFGIATGFSPLITGFSIIIAYNFIRFYEIKENNTSWFKKWFNQHKWLLLLLVLVSFISLVVILYFTNFSKKALLVLLPFGFITFFYVIPIFKSKKKHFSFRYFPSIKIVSIALTWAGVTVFLPLYDASISFDIGVFIEFMQRFLIVMVITLPFDIRDVYDDDIKLKTVPQLIGLKNTKALGLLLSILFVLLSFLNPINEKYMIFVEILIALLSVLLLIFTTTNRNKYYTGFWIEAIPIFWFLLLFVI